MNISDSIVNEEDIEGCGALAENRSLQEISNCVNNIAAPGGGGIVDLAAKLRGAALDR